MRLIDCDSTIHSGAVLDILNDAILTSTALYDYKPRTPESMVAWFRSKRDAGYPVVGAIDDEGTLLGFASYGPFRAWPAYKYSVEHSVYVQRSQRGKGVGLALLRNLIQVATLQQYHTIIGGIDVNNMASIALHEKLGFVRAGTIQHAAFKFGRWLDLSFYQLLLSGPVNPVDG
jgi:phosphinothricin acetyltransferase